MGPIVAFGLIPVIMAFIAGFVFLTVSEGDLTEAALAMRKQLTTTGIATLAGLVICVMAFMQEGAFLLMGIGIVMSAPTAFVLGTLAAAKRRSK